MKKSTEISQKIKHYFKTEKLFMKIGGITLTGKESCIYKIYSIFAVYVTCVSYTLVEARELFRNEFFGALEAGIYFNGMLLNSSLIFVAHWNRVKIGKLIDKLENDPFIANAERGGEVEEEIIHGWYYFKQKQSLTFFTASTATISLSMLYSFIIRVRSNDYHDWILPFGPMTVLNVTYSPNYEISWMYQYIVVFYTAVNGCATTLIMASILSFISVQFKLLQNSLQRLVKNSYTKMLKANGIFSSPSLKLDVSSIPWKYLKDSIKEVVDYHINIIELAKNLEEIFSITILTIYLCTLGILGCEVYRASLLSAEPAHVAVAVIETLVAPFYAFLLCYNGQQMTNEGLNVAHCAYECDFVGSDVRFQKALMIITMRNQKPVMIKAGKFIETSVLTFLWIIRSAYSAFMLLRNVQNK